MTKKEIIQYLIIAILAGVIFFVLFSSISKLNDRLTAIEQKPNLDLQNKVLDLEVQQKGLDVRIDLTRYEIADVWFSLQSKEASDKFTKFFIENEKFDQCKKNLTDVSVVNSWYALNQTGKFNNVVLTYNNGYTVFYKDGSVKCYPEVIEDFYPANISCDTLCQK